MVSRGLALTLRFLLLALLSMIGAALQVNAPSIGGGYGVIVLASVLSLLYLPPHLASLAVLAGSLASLPIVYLSGSMFLLVALLGALLRPLFVLLSGLVGARAGPTAGVMTYAALDPLVAVSTAIAYYGNDGIHVAMAVYDVIVAFLAYMAYRAHMERGLGGLILSLLGSTVYLASTMFYLAPLAAIGGLILSATPALPRGLAIFKPLALASLIILALGVSAGFQGIIVNLSITLYPFKPSSYTEERWSVDSEPCGSIENVFEGVYDPERLRIVHECGVIEGIIAGPPVLAEDGDIVFDVEVEYSSVEPLQTLGSIILRDGRVHVEIVPKDRVILEDYDHKLCVGDRVKVWGPVVVDTDHAQWTEIHPALGVEVLRRGEGPCIIFDFSSS